MFIVQHVYNSALCLMHWYSVGYDCVTSVCSGVLYIAVPGKSSEVTCPEKESFARTFDSWVVLSVFIKKG